jgi:hypothetical protein
MDIPAVTVRVSKDGVVTAVEVDGHPEPTDVVETTPAEPIPPFGDEEYKAGFRTFWVG